MTDSKSKPPALASVAAVKRALRERATPARAAASQRYFKTGAGEYGEGDRFLGVTVPDQRVIARRARDLPLDALDALLASPWHEERLVALLVLVDRYERGDAATKDEAARFYVEHLASVDNWDLVDSSAWQILGRHVRAGARSPLLRLARSKRLWDRRVAMIATAAFIREGEPEPARTIARMLLGDREDLMHKAVGWMLRELGARVSRRVLEEFLEAHADEMPRTALRYAIEHLPPDERRAWMARGPATTRLRSSSGSRSTRSSDAASSPSRTTRGGASPRRSGD